MYDVKIINNINETLLGNLRTRIQEGSRVSIAAACFSMYAWSKLKKELSSVESVRFLFTAPAFLQEKADRQKREFYIPRLEREKSLSGTAFEIRLRNELAQSATARECADWIRKKVIFRSNATEQCLQGFVTVDSASEPASEPSSESDESQAAYAPVQGFTTADLGCGQDGKSYTLINCLDGSFARQYMRLFDEMWNNTSMMQDVTEAVIENITAVYAENAPEFIYFVTLWNVFSEFLDDITEDDLPNDATGFKQSKIWSLLYDFQKDAVLAIISKLEKYNGCILADSVGLGKTFTALAVIKYYENRNRSVLVLCPKKLAENWNTYKDNYVNNPVASDRLNYDVLFHTDLSRDGGKSNGLDLDRLNWGNYDLIVIDESHNFRNGYGTHVNTHENRYKRLMDKVIRSGVRTKVLMLSATPVNNRFADLKNQLALAYEGNSDILDQRLGTSKSLDDIFRQAQGAFTAWSKLDHASRTTDALLRKLDFDFFELLDSVTIARSRRHIEKYYDAAKIGTFPERLHPISLRPSLTDTGDAASYNNIYARLTSLSLCVYTPSGYIMPSSIAKYRDLSHNKGDSLTQVGREQGIRRLMRINLLKRLESSVNSFRLTIQRIAAFITGTIEAIDRFEREGIQDIEMFDAQGADLDMDDENNDILSTGSSVQIALADMDWVTWREGLRQDEQILKDLEQEIAPVTPEHDSKLQELLRLLAHKVEHPVNPGNKKVLIFSAFSDTAAYLYDNVSAFMKEKFGLDSAVITGSIDGRTTIKGFKATLNNVLTCFSPVSKDREVLMPGSQDNIDILIATDCISEGQNLQDCDYLVNYDIHWNPVRIIQRFGRIDRIGSSNNAIQLVNFWPDLTLDDYINLKSRVETRMKITVMTSTGDDDPINLEEQGDLEYRKEQLRRLQEEVVNIEDMSDGISIMDLGLNEFRLDLLDYMKRNGSGKDQGSDNGKGTGKLTAKDMDLVPKGLHAVVPATEDLPKGIIFVLKNLNDSINIKNRNRIHPFYMVYMGSDGECVCDYLNPKKLLDSVRLLCRGKDRPIKELCSRFNRETRNGRSMSRVSKLLTRAIGSVTDLREKNDVMSLFSAGGTTALIDSVSGLNDFELICFLVVQDPGTGSAEDRQKSV